ADPGNRSARSSASAIPPRSSAPMRRRSPAPPSVTTLPLEDHLWVPHEHLLDVVLAETGVEHHRHGAIEQERVIPVRQLPCPCGRVIVHGKARRVVREHDLLAPAAADELDERLDPLWSRQER